MPRDYVAEVAALRKEVEGKVPPDSKFGLLMRYSETLYSVLNEYCQNGAWIDDKVNERMAAMEIQKTRRKKV